MAPKRHPTRRPREVQIRADILSSLREINNRQERDFHVSNVKEWLVKLKDYARGLTRMTVRKEVELFYIQALTCLHYDVLLMEKEEVTILLDILAEFLKQKAWQDDVPIAIVWLLAHRDFEKQRAPVATFIKEGLARPYMFRLLVENVLMMMAQDKPPMIAIYYVSLLKEVADIERKAVVFSFLDEINSITSKLFQESPIASPDDNVASAFFDSEMASASLDDDMPIAALDDDTFLDDEEYEPSRRRDRIRLAHAYLAKKEAPSHALKCEWIYLLVRLLYLDDDNESTTERNFLLSEWVEHALQLDADPSANASWNDYYSRLGSEEREKLAVGSLNAILPSVSMIAKFTDSAAAQLQAAIMCLVATACFSCQVAQIAVFESAFFADVTNMLMSIRGTEEIHKNKRTIDMAAKAVLNVIFHNANALKALAASGYRSAILRELIIGVKSGASTPCMLAILGIVYPADDQVHAEFLEHARQYKFAEWIETATFDDDRLIDSIAALVARTLPRLVVALDDKAQSDSGRTEMVGFCVGPLKPEAHAFFKASHVMSWIETFTAAARRLSEITGGTLWMAAASSMSSTPVRIVMGTACRAAEVWSNGTSTEIDYFPQFIVWYWTGLSTKLDRNKTFIFDRLCCYGAHPEFALRVAEDFQLDVDLLDEDAIINILCDELEKTLLSGAEGLSLDQLLYSPNTLPLRKDVISALAERAKRNSSESDDVTLNVIAEYTQFCEELKEAIMAHFADDGSGGLSDLTEKNQFCGKGVMHIVPHPNAHDAYAQLAKRLKNEKYIDEMQKGRYWFECVRGHIADERIKCTSAELADNPQLFEDEHHFGNQTGKLVLLDNFEYAFERLAARYASPSENHGAKQSGRSTSATSSRASSSESIPDLKDPTEPSLARYGTRSFSYVFVYAITLGTFPHISLETDFELVARPDANESRKEVSESTSYWRTLVYSMKMKKSIPPTYKGHSLKELNKASLIIGPCPPAQFPKSASQVNPARSSSNNELVAQAVVGDDMMIQTLEGLIAVVRVPKETSTYKPPSGLRPCTCPVKDDSAPIQYICNLSKKDGLNFHTDVLTPYKTKMHHHGANVGLCKTHKVVKIVGHDSGAPIPEAYHRYLYNQTIQ